MRSTCPGVRLVGRIVLRHISQLVGRIMHWGQVSWTYHALGSGLLDIPCLWVRLVPRHIMVSWTMDIHALGSGQTTGFLFTPAIESDQSDISCHRVEGLQRSFYMYTTQGLEMHTKPWVRARASKEYWEKMKPAGDKRTRSNRFPWGNPREELLFFSLSLVFQL